MTAVEQFALGSAEAANHVELRSRLAATAPHGDDLDSPWSTYVQDVIICTDAGLAAASVDLDPIQFGSNSRSNLSCLHCRIAMLKFFGRVGKTIGRPRFSAIRRWRPPSRFFKDL
jgi:hypothetical protein